MFNTGQQRQFTPAGASQEITTLTSAASLTVPAGAKYAFITCEAQAVRWRDDGTAPTAAIGHRLAVGESLWYAGNLGDLQFFEESATANLFVSYYA